MARARKMVAIDVVETSGVDHPAHLHEGWVVAKAAGTATATEVLDRFLTPQTREHTVPEITQEQVDATVAEAVTKAVAEAVAPLNETIATVTAERDEAVAKSAPVEDAETLLTKALGDMPDAVREMILKDRADLAKAREDVVKAADALADSEAVTASRETFKSLSIDHETVAPALRRLEASDPEIAKALTEALTKANAQADSGKVFEEIGRGGSAAATGTVMTKATAVAKALLDAGTVPTIEAGVAKAFTDNPDLYAEYQSEKAGN